mmetsp:Transcript_104958/g.203151  ORF Transcript_104958/g.203151 Transcript_104958/m.203151 type:complete len:455 (-) Transcript_104958:194-1558(-)
MVDACEWEQSALLQAYVLSRHGELEQLATAEDSAAGPRSIAPFVPCAASRLPHIFRAARLTAEDVLWDLGCGDGIVLHEAASRYGCRCVGLDIDASCLTVAKRRATALGVAGLCTWLQCDLTILPQGSLGEHVDKLAALAKSDVIPAPPSVALVFLTGTGLVRISQWLHREWIDAAHRLRLLTCVESLDSAVDYTDPAGLFGDSNELDWEVCHDHARWGVFVVPPFKVTVDSWRLAGDPPLQLTRSDADVTVPVHLPAILSHAELQLIHELSCRYMTPSQEESTPSLFDLPDDHAGFHASAETALHGLSEHRVFYLHSCSDLATEACGLPRIKEKLVSAMRAHDHWGLLKGRDVNLRSFEYHVYSTGGSVLDPQHRDDGSLLTLSILLSLPGDFTGGEFVTWQGGQRIEHALAQGDGILFASEKRHNVNRVSGDRRSLVLELWEGPRNHRNRHS